MTGLLCREQGLSRTGDQKVLARQMLAQKESTARVEQLRRRQVAYLEVARQEQSGGSHGHAFLLGVLILGDTFLS